MKFFANKTSIIIEIVLLVAVLAGVYYFFSTSTQDVSTTNTSVDSSLLGQNFVLFMKAMNQDKLSFSTTDYKASPLILGSYLKDFSEIIRPNATRGRADPFIPYVAPRSLR